MILNTVIPDRLAGDRKRRVAAAKARAAAKAAKHADLDRVARDQHRLAVEYRMRAMSAVDAAQDRRNEAAREVAKHQHRLTDLLSATGYVAPETIRGVKLTISAAEDILAAKEAALVAALAAVPDEHAAAPNAKKTTK